MSKTNLSGYTLRQLEKLLEQAGEKSFRGRQLFKWFYQKRIYDFNQMSDLTKSLRESLAGKFTFDLLPLERLAQAEDGTQKMVFRLTDGNLIETVLIPSDRDEKRTLCVSSQAGCALDCRFCATGQGGFKRDLSVYEIVSQLLYARDNYGPEAFSNIVFMGMGEPLHNYENVIDAIRIATDTLGLGIGAKRITISTVGIVPRIKQLADSGLKTKLAISLNASTDKKRLQIMPITKTYTLEQLMTAAGYYAEKTKTRVTFEYILFEDFNDTMADIKALAELIRGIPCKINIFAYNPVEGLPFKRPSEEKLEWFSRQLYPRAPAVTIRKSRGRDIDAACGQLAGRINNTGGMHVA